MIVTRAPLRVSLAGGGSDLPEFFQHEEGSVLGLAVSMYVYVTALPLSPVAPENIRFTYRKSESVQSSSELVHPVARVALGERSKQLRVNLATMADVPGGTGLGSSSAFTVALLAALDQLEGNLRSPDELAQHAIRIERNYLGEAGGWQDQAQAAIGGFRLYNFAGSDFTYSESLEGNWISEVEQSLVLVHSGLPPRKSAVHQENLREKIRQGATRRHLREAALVAREGFETLRSASNAAKAHNAIIRIVEHGMIAKAKSTSSVGGPLEELISLGKRRGALAGKLLGAGGGGFVLFVTDLGGREEFIRQWGAQHAIPLGLSHSGVTVLLDDGRTKSY